MVRGRGREREREFRQWGRWGRWRLEKQLCDEKERRK